VILHHTQPKRAVNNRLTFRGDVLGSSIGVDK